MAAVKLGAKAVGSIVKIKEDGVLTDYIIVHKGLPSDLYDESCNGVWLLRKAVFSIQQWGGMVPFPQSNIFTSLNTTFFERFSPDLQKQIKLVKIPYCTGTYSDRKVNAGKSGASCRIFLLSPNEIGFPFNGIAFAEDGAKLSYFPVNGSQCTERVAYSSDNPQSTSNWYTRTWYLSSASGSLKYIYSVDGSGSYHGISPSTSCGVRPAFILPSTLMVSDDGAVITNQPPTVPSSLTVPSAIYGGKAVSLSWGASTDPDGNLEGYIVERSVNGGSSWVQVYQGPARTTTNTVPFGTTTVTYRVKAYDSEGEFSGYKTSAAVTVINNRAPGAPGSITVPEQVQGGGQLAVTWGAAADVDGNLSGYSLERQVDGGAWTEVYNGANLSFTDNITKGWESVAYRVRAYDSHGEYSAYTASEVRTVNNNTPPEISCEETELGVKSAGFSVTYQVDDEEEDPVTVTEVVDGAELRSFQAELNAENTFSVAGEDFLKLQNGPHSMKISATDGMGESAHEFSFTKEITSASVTLSEPMEADGKITLCALSVKGEIPEDAAFTAEVTNNAKDEAPVWEDCATQVKNGLNYIFENETAQNGFAFNFRIAVERGESGQGGYITSIQGGFQ